MDAHRRDNPTMPAQPEIVAEPVAEPVPTDVFDSADRGAIRPGGVAPDPTIEQAAMTPLDLHGRQALLRDLRFLDDF